MYRRAWFAIVSFLLVSCGDIGVGPGSAATNAEVIAGLREALAIGSTNAATRLNRVDAYLRDTLIRIAFPPDAKKVETTLRSAGFGQLADNVIVSMNRAAERAAGAAKPIFIDAITEMTIVDGMTILRGSNDEATTYLRTKTWSPLFEAFQPVVKSALDAVEATRYWADAINTYNSLPFVEKVNPDLPSYVTDRALHGLFVKLADEEMQIRTNPAARVTDLLKRVFGRESRHLSQ